MPKGKGYGTTKAKGDQFSQGKKPATTGRANAATRGKGKKKGLRKQGY